MSSIKSFIASQKVPGDISSSVTGMIDLDSNSSTPKGREVLLRQE
jgi:hypothetical protein